MFQRKLSPPSSDLKLRQLSSSKSLATTYKTTRHQDSWYGGWTELCTTVTQKPNYAHCNCLRICKLTLALTTLLAIVWSQIIRTGALSISELWQEASAHPGLKDKNLAPPEYISIITTWDNMVNDMTEM